MIFLVVIEVWGPSPIIWGHPGPPWCSKWKQQREHSRHVLSHRFIPHFRVRPLACRLNKSNVRAYAHANGTTLIQLRSKRTINFKTKLQYDSLLFLVQQQQSWYNHSFSASPGWHSPRTAARRKMSSVRFSIAPMAGWKRVRSLEIPAVGSCENSYCGFTLWSVIIDLTRYLNTFVLWRWFVRCRKRDSRERIESQSRLTQTDSGGEVRSYIEDIEEYVLQSLLYTLDCWCLSRNRRNTNDRYIRFR